MLGYSWICLGFVGVGNLVLRVALEGVVHRQLVTVRKPDGFVSLYMTRGVILGPRAVRAANSGDSARLTGPL